MADKKISALTAATTPLAGTEVLPIVQSGTTKQVSIANVTAGRAVAASSLTTTAGTSVLGTAASTLLATFGDNLTVNTTILQIKRNAGVTDKPILQGIIAGIGASNIILQKDGGDVEIGAGNVIMSTAAKGIDFSANTGTAGMTSELLNWYETGTWTPIDSSGAGLSFTGTDTNCFYTRVGNVVTVTVAATFPTTASANSVLIGGLPFTSKATTNGVAAVAISYSDYGAGIYGRVTQNATTFTLFAQTTTGSALTNLLMSGKNFRGTAVYLV